MRVLKTICRTTRAAMLFAPAVVVCVVASGSAAGSWVRIESEHFLLVGDAAERDVRAVGQRLEHYRGLVERLLPNTALLDAAPTVVVVFESHKSMRPVKPVRDGKVQDSVAGIFRAGDTVDYVLMTAAGGEKAYASVLSAYGQALLEATLPAPPLWASRGVSAYFSTAIPPVAGRAAIMGRVPESALDRARVRWVPLSEIIAAGPESPVYRTADDRQTFDAVSWATVHALLHVTPGGSEGLSRYLGLAATGRTADASFREAFGIDIADLDRQVHDYVQRNLVKEKTMALDERQPASRAPEVESLSDAEVDARLADVLLQLDRLDEAESLVTRALAADEGLAQGYLTRGLLEVRRQKFTEGWSDLEKAAELGESDYRTQFALGHVALRQLSGGRLTDADGPRLTRARSALLRAVTLDSGSVEAQFDLARVAFHLGDLDNARQVAEKAVEAAPTREDLRLFAARIALAQGDTGGARKAIGTLAARAARAETLQGARDLLGEIARAETAAKEEQARAKARAAAEAEAAAAAAAGTEGTASGYKLRLRALGEGEARGLGQIAAIDCGGKGIVYRATLDGRAMKLFSKTFQTVEFISYRDSGGSVSCGPQTGLDHIYVTWRPLAADLAKAAGGADGEVVAIELLPKDYKP